MCRLRSESPLSIKQTLRERERKRKEREMLEGEMVGEIVVEGSGRGGRRGHDDIFDCAGENKRMGNRQDCVFRADGTRMIKL